ncbi:MAG TPA: ABC transporter ATP-binding protein/permease, partial [Candidatus Acutalibacter pullistercoris]|nr:ABC transporter ATP-binding protein/permease [Candidatus Acutalibacter pullistercoris]
MLKTLGKCVREYKRPSILCLIFIVGEAIMECIIPFIIANLVNEIKAGIAMPRLLGYAGLLVVMAGLSLAFGALAGTTCAKASCGFARNLRRDMFYKIQGYSFENIDKFSVSSLVTRLTTDVTNVQMAYMMIIRGAIRSPLMLIFSFIMGFIMGGKMAFIFLVTVPILGIGLTIITRKTMPLFRRVFRKYDNLNASIQENIRGMRVVKAYVREDYEKKKFDYAAEDVQKDFTRAERILAINNPLMQFCIYVVMIFVMSFGSYTVITTQGLALDVGQMSSLLTYSFQILMSLMMLSMIFVMITMALESAERIMEVLTEESTLQNPQHPVMEVKDGSIDFDHVSFKYSKKASRYALSDINLHIKSGEVIGVLGGTGSSKTTLIQLIPRLYDATEGAVKVGGLDVRDYDLETLRNQVAVVLQKNELFSGTIKENLRWGNPNATDEELEEACKLSQADEFIQQFPQKYDTHIEQGGTNVSG